MNNSRSMSAASATTGCYGTQTCATTISTTLVSAQMLAPSNMGWAGPAALPFARCRWRGPPCTGGGCLDDPPRCATAVCRLFFHPHESTSWGPRAAISPCSSLASLWSFWCLSGTLPLQAQEAPRPCRAVAPSCFAPKATLRMAAQRLRRGHGFPFPQGCPEPLGSRETGQVGQYFGAFTAELYNSSTPAAATAALYVAHCFASRQLRCRLATLQDLASTRLVASMPLLQALLCRAHLRRP